VLWTFQGLDQPTAAGSDAFRSLKRDPFPRVDERSTTGQHLNTSPETGGFKMTAYLINHLRQPGVVNSEVLDYLNQVRATLDPMGER
jgi:hypothetical protein